MTNKKELNVEEMEKINGGIIEKVVDKVIDKGIDLITGKGGSKEDESAKPAGGDDTFTQGNNQNEKSLQQTAKTGNNSQSGIKIS